MLSYKWKSIGFEADANDVGRELEKIENVDGSVDAKNVVRFAEKNVDSELHKCFEWNNDIAGEKYRMMQASQILCSISIVTSETDTVDKEVVRAYVNIREQETGKRKFKNISRVLENDDEYEQIKVKAFNELSNCKEKYSKLLELGDLKELIFDLYKGM